MNYVYVIVDDRDKSEKLINFIFEDSNIYIADQDSISIDKLIDAKFAVAISNISSILNRNEEMDFIINYNKEFYAILYPDIEIEFHNITPIILNDFNDEDAFNDIKLILSDSLSTVVQEKIYEVSATYDEKAVIIKGLGRYHNKALANIELRVKRGYTFKGIYLNEELLSYETDFNITVLSDINLEIKTEVLVWNKEVKNYFIDLIADEQYAKAKNEIELYYSLYPEDLSLLEIYIDIQQGKEKTINSKAQAAYKELLRLSGNKKKYLKKFYKFNPIYIFKIGDKNYFVHYYQKFKLPVAEKEGYIFKYYDYEGDHFTNHILYKYEKNIELTPVFELACYNIEYSVNVDTDKNFDLCDTYTYSEGSIELNSLELFGRRFLGYYDKDEDCYITRIPKDSCRDYNIEILFSSFSIKLVLLECIKIGIKHILPTLLFVLSIIFFNDKNIMTPLILSAITFIYCNIYALIAIKGDINKHYAYEYLIMLCSIVIMITKISQTELFAGFEIKEYIQLYSCLTLIICYGSCELENYYTNKSFRSCLITIINLISYLFLLYLTLYLFPFDSLLLYLNLALCSAFPLATFIVFYRMRKKAFSIVCFIVWFISTILFFFGKMIFGW